MNNQTEQIYLLNPTGGQSSSLLQRISENSSANQVNLENVEDFSKVCRTCATITDQVVPVFSGEGLQNNLAEKINKHLPIQMSATDSLPTAVCVQCAHTVLAWHELAACCAQADAALRTRLQQIQDRKPARNSSGPFVDNNQRNESQDARAAPPEYPRNKPPLQSCKYCPAQASSNTYKAHLEDEHLELLFHCDECNSFVDRKDFILHMSLHLFQSTVREEMEERARERQDRLERQGNAEAVGNQNSSANNRQEAPANTPAHAKVETKRNRKIKNESAEASPAQKIVKTERSTRSVKSEIRSVVDVPPAPTTTNKQTTATVTKAMPPTMKAEVVSNASNANNNQNIFSDHSDTEDLVTIPPSVFQAIEDTQDGQTFTTNSTNGTEPGQNQDTSDSESDNESLQEKAKKNSNKKTRQCPICSKTYTASSSYFYHIKYSHKGVRDHECEICGGKFVTRHCLTQHMSTHSQQCNFECKVCKKKFRTNASLYIHEQSHNGVKTYSCDSCDVSFRWRTHLMRHVKRHKAEKGHVCGTCGRGFTIHCDLLRHKRTHEAGNHQCAQCGAKFAQIRYLKVHMDRKHINPIIVK